MAIDMSQFYQVFFDESAEHLAEMEALLLDLDVDNPDSEQLNAIFRAAHSIKGSSGTFGFTDLAETTHVLENLLDRIRKEELSLRADMVDAFLEAGDLLKTMLAAHRGQGEADPSVVETVCQRLRSFSAHDGVSALQPETVIKTVPGDVAPLQTSSVVVPHRFNIQFVPTLVSAQGDGVKHFIEDLGALGQVEILCQPQDMPDCVGLWKLRLVTESGKETFTEQLDFISDSDSWRISEEEAQDDGGQEAFGFFSDGPGSPENECGYGFFEPLPEALPAVENVLVEGDGFGFFKALPTTPVPSPEKILSACEEGEGYGFFAPLISPVPTGAPTAPAPAEKTAKGDAEPAKAVVKAKANAAAPGGDSSIRVSVEKVDQLINLVGELVITQAMLLQAAMKMQDDAPESLVNGLAQLERNTRDLQESVMSIRMLPMSFVFSRFPRVVRDLSGKLGKQVELKTSGETTELDKGLIERITDPLTHLIRNSLDHGIELPEQRIAAGKSPVGTITLKAYHQGGNIVIEVGDDGAGLNRQKILAKAREKGLPVSDQMADQEVFGLIFEAGFSTADQVTDVSGRGVGMDVVRKNIHALGGRVEIDSMAGIGTRMTVRLPLTLAILDGMSVAVGDQTYILPLASVVESLQPRAEDIKTLSNQARVIQVRGEYLPVLVLHELFNLQSCWSSLAQGIMVVLDADGTKAALFVDALIGQHQVVIKSLEANYRRVHGISGATIMGDGHVALILDVPALAGLARTHMQRAA